MPKAVIFSVEVATITLVVGSVFLKESYGRLIWDEVSTEKKESWQVPVAQPTPASAESRAQNALRESRKRKTLFQDLERSIAIERSTEINLTFKLPSQQSRLRTPCTEGR